MVRSSWWWPARESASAPCSTRRSSIRTVGLVGDSWIDRFSRHTPDGSPNPVMQLTLMNARAAALVAQTVDRWPLAGDQLYVDLELGYDNLPAGTQLQVGTAVVEITEEPHTGCAKFAERFGMDAVRLVNSPVGREHNLPRRERARRSPVAWCAPATRCASSPSTASDGHATAHVGQTRPFDQRTQPSRSRARTASASASGARPVRATSASGTAASPPSASSTRARGDRARARHRCAPREPGVMPSASTRSAQSVSGYAPSAMSAFVPAAAALRRDPEPRAPGGRSAARARR